MHPRFGPWLDHVRSADTAVLVASDFDGTLAPIVVHPGPVRPLEGAIEALVQLAATPHVEVAIVSGRSLEDLAQRCGAIRPLHLCAEHGSVVFDARGTRGISEGPVDAGVLSELAAVTAQLVREVPGARFETKGYGVVLQLRAVAPGARADLAHRFRDAATVRSARVLEGRMDVEARLGGRDKGTALRMLLGERAQTTAVLYAGDDATDEDAYRVVGALPLGLAFHVASEERPLPDESNVAVLPGPHAWLELLDSLAEGLAGRSSSVGLTRSPRASASDRR